MMVCFIFGVSLVFGFIEEIGYMARISFVFDDVMLCGGSSSHVFYLQSIREETDEGYG